MDQHLQLREHVNKICRSSMSALKRISLILNFLSKESTEKLILAFVSSRIDYCTALLFGISEKDICKLYKIVLLELCTI